MGKHPAVMGTGPELDGILSPKRSGRVPERRSNTSAFRPAPGSASRVLDPTPEREGIIFPGASGRVLMTAGYPAF